MTALGIRAPRLNANDDAVVVSRVLVKQGDVVRKDAVLAEVESDKSTFEVQAPEDGFVLKSPRARAHPSPQEASSSGSAHRPARNCPKQKS